ncbi:hypothetical protein HanRHA438_Chr00c19g0851761 [Helianthus annuus]|nr:hypothetical protein HanRHA438_Chr00c19g0851761 [Helianthus annuus]
MFTKMVPRIKLESVAWMILVRNSCLVLNMFLKNLLLRMVTSSKRVFGYGISLSFSCSSCILIGSADGFGICMVKTVATSMANSRTLTRGGMQ